jgi:hypothetical protein
MMVIMLILLTILVLIGFVSLIILAKPAPISQKKPDVLVNLQSDLFAPLNAAKDLMETQDKLKDYFEPVKPQKPNPPPKEIVEPLPLMDIGDDDKPRLDPNAICRLTGRQVKDCNCEDCTSF